MSITSINQSVGFEQTKYDTLVNQAQSGRVDTSLVDKALLNALNTGKDFDAAIKSVTAQLPELAKPNVNTLAPLGIWIGMPSPGALVASLIVTDSAEQRTQNKETIRSQGEAIAESMMKQAGEMRKAAALQFGMAIASSATQIASGAAAIGMLTAGSVKVTQTSSSTTTVNGVSNTTITTGTGTKVDAQLLSAKVNAFTSIMGGVSSALQAGGQFGASMYQAGIKEMEADQESTRAMRDALRAHNDAINELISKSLDFMNTMQQQTNQTTSRILA